MEQSGHRGTMLKLAPICLGIILLGSDQFLIQDGAVYTYIHHIGRDRVGSGAVAVSIFKNGETVPLRETTYYLR